MSDQPGDILDEAGRVFDALLRRASRAGIFGAPRRPDARDRAPDQEPAPDQDPDRPEAAEPGDAWAAATAEPPPAEPPRAEPPRAERGSRAHGGAEEPRIATGAPECRDCPVCRAIAIRREAGGDAARHLRDAGESLLAAALDVIAAADRARDGRPRGGAERDADTFRKRPRQESAGRPAGTSERSEERRDRPEGDAWSAATGGSGD
ncbi:hypothetical protein [Actinomadura sp. WAC 06369]|uniref:hypothetical protein n=1 Tax=Actinomadura sp. WAC 06369 TaxID=2203193 RepID=UPI000F77A177|nr:hypothetical protein [Actinomadura sp. WAC 06369]RSN59674.1 hypothetical protein DMH08_22505 [Actinomadura sp. WAC 06369]